MNEARSFAALSQIHHHENVLIKYTRYFFRQGHPLGVFYLRIDVDACHIRRLGLTGYTFVLPQRMHEPRDI